MASIRGAIDGKLISAAQETKKILLLARLQYMVAITIGLPIARPVQSVDQLYRVAAGIATGQIENQMTARQREGASCLSTSAREAYRRRQRRRSRRSRGACRRCA
jgi:hypothetical protein